MFVQILKNVLQRRHIFRYRSVANSSLTVARIDIDLKFKMGGRIDTILMCVKFGDDQISSLDFSFIGRGVYP